MLKSPSRNHRSKGIKVKNVIYCCLLLGLGCWFIYQVKHSYDQKKEFDEKDAKFSLNTRSENEIFRLGRKDLNSQVENTATESEKHEEEEAEEEETVVEEEENKHGEEQEEDNTEEKEDERRVDGEDEIHEHDHEKSDADVDREEDFIDEEEGVEGDGKESEERDSEDEDGQMGNENSLEGHDHEDTDRTTNEAREEHYKADDASSAVTHDTQTFTSENENDSSENSNENTETNTLEQENEVNNEEVNAGQNKTALMVEDGEIPENEEKGYGSVLVKLEDSPMIKTEVSDERQLSSNFTEVSTETHGLALHNGTETISEFSQSKSATMGDPTSKEGSNLQTIALEHSNTDTVTSSDNQSDSNTTISTKPEDAEATRRESSEFVASGMVIRSNASAEAEDNSGSSMTQENTDATQNEKSDTSTDTVSSETENAEVQHDSMDSSDSSITLEETQVRTDLDTLPDIRTEGSNSEDAAEE